MLRAWQKGRTGFPLVDAGMRQLWLTGWMQQSIRMVCAAFLTEYLNIHWVHGARSAQNLPCPDGIRGMHKGGSRLVFPVKLLKGWHRVQSRIFHRQCHLLSLSNVGQVVS